MRFDAHTRTLPRVRLLLALGCLLSLAIASTADAYSGFLRRSGRRIVDGQGRPVAP